jgi:ribosomal-protein-alanine N-acetyltransferase
MRELRGANEADLEVLLAIQEACAGAPDWSAAVWQEILRHQEIGRTAFVAQVEDRVAGFVVVGEVAGTAELESIAVLPCDRGRSLGRSLCQRGVEWARTLGAETMLLEVRVSNKGAIRLYKTLGFVEQGRRTRYYSRPEEDAVMMSLSLRPTSPSRAAV